jgi:HK97 gp10 family phage protein
MDFSIKITGLDQINAVLKQLPENIGRRAANTAVRAAGMTIRKAIMARIPKGKTGNLAKSIKVKKQRDQQGKTTYTVYSSAPHAHLVEYGTAPHIIVAGRKTNRKSTYETGKKTLSDGSSIFGTQINHPGAKAEPFFRPAFDESAERALANMREVMAKAVARAATKWVES